MSAAELEVAVRELTMKIKRDAASKADSALNIMRNAALEVLSRNGTGRRYGRHIASAPGQPPAPDKGNLRRNWRQRKILSGSLRITLQLKSQMFYAGFLEEGTRKMSPRPYHDRIKKKAAPEIAALFANL